MSWSRLDPLAGGQLLDPVPRDETLRLVTVVGKLLLLAVPIPFVDFRPRSVDQLTETNDILTGPVRISLEVGLQDIDLILGQNEASSLGSPPLVEEVTVHWILHHHHLVGKIILEYWSAILAS